MKFRDPFGFLDVLTVLFMSYIVRSLFVRNLFFLHSLVVKKTMCFNALLVLLKRHLGEFNCPLNFQMFRDNSIVRHKSAIFIVFNSNLWNFVVVNLIIQYIAWLCYVFVWDDLFLIIPVCASIFHEIIDLLAQIITL